MNRMLMAAILALAVIQSPIISQDRGPSKAGPKSKAEIQQQLRTLRGEIKTKKWTFKVGENKIVQYRRVLVNGTKVPVDLSTIVVKVNGNAKVMVKIDRTARNAYQKKNPGMLPGRKVKPRVQYVEYSKRPAFDWRKYGKVTDIRNQGGCGSCWDFSALAAFESSYAIRNGVKIDASEQHILDNNAGGSCSGGWWMGVFDYLIKNGTCSESQYPYKGTKGAVKKVATPYRAVAWGFVAGNGKTPTEAQMKQALVQNGVLSIAVNATSAFQYYKGGVFNENAPGNINHAINLVGWDNKKGKRGAWLIKNSWGTSWGDQGYMWIEFGCNRIGYNASWVRAHNTHYRLPPSYYKTRQNIKPHKAVSKPK